MVHMQVYRAPEPPSRIFPECVSFQMFWQYFKRFEFSHQHFRETESYRPCARMFIQHLRFIQILLTLILLRFRYLSESHTTVYTMIVILKQVLWGISAIEGTTNNDCHKNIFQTAALSLTWNTEVRIQPICYSNRLGKLIHSYSSFPSAEV